MSDEPGEREWLELEATPRGRRKRGPRGRGSSQRRRPDTVLVTVRCGGPGKDGQPGACRREVGWVSSHDGVEVYSGQGVTRTLTGTDLWADLDQPARQFTPLGDLENRWQSIGPCRRCRCTTFLHPELLRRAVRDRQRDLATVFRSRQ